MWVQMIELEKVLSVCADSHLLFETKFEHLPKVVYSLLNLCASLTNWKPGARHSQFGGTNVIRTPDLRPACASIGLFRFAAFHT